MVRIGLFPGAFDPATNGHLDIITRGALLFDELVVAVGQNPEKESLFTAAQRVEMLRELVRDMPHVRVESYTGLTVEFARRLGATAILRGIRNASDLQFELELAATNRDVAGIETVFILPSARYAFTSSRLIRQVAAMGGDVSSLVPPAVAERLRAKVRPQDTQENTKTTKITKNTKKK
jgi:pantetheine-phosphate adenylyltransferase